MRKRRRREKKLKSITMKPPEIRLKISDFFIYFCFKKFPFFCSTKFYKIKYGHKGHRQQNFFASYTLPQLVSPTLIGRNDFCFVEFWVNFLS